MDATQKETTVGQPQASRVRDIFRYEDDRGPRFGDPLRINTAIATGLETALTDTDEDSLFSSLAHEDIRVSGPASGKLVPVLCDAFGVSRLDTKTGEGMTDGEILDLYTSFLDWVDGVKKNTENLPSSSTPIPGSPLAGSDSPPAEPTETSRPAEGVILGPPQAPPPPERPKPRAVPNVPSWAHGGGPGYPGGQPTEPESTEPRGAMGPISDW